MTAFISDPKDLTLHDSGFVKLPSGVEISRLPIFDHRHGVFARLGWGPAAEWLEKCGQRGWRLPTTDEMEELHQHGFWIPPFTMPTADQLKEAGIPLTVKKGEKRVTNPAVNTFRNRNMRSLEWCRIHDEQVFSFLEGWAGVTGVANAGKHWTLPLGTIFGWWRKPPPSTSKIQRARPSTASNFPPHGPGYTDYATTFFAVRECPNDDDDSKRSEPSLPPESEDPPMPSKPGSKGKAVAVWQRFLLSYFSELGQVALPKYGADGDHGGETEAWTRKWIELEAVGDETEAVTEVPSVPPMKPKAPSQMPPVRFRQARNYRKGRHTPVLWIVIHTAEMNEDLVGEDGNAEALMNYAATTSRQASWHYSVDSDSITQSVRDEDTAWHGGGGGVNTRSIGIEHAGRAMQGKAGWSDDYSQKMLRLSAKLVAELCKKHEVPVRKLGASQLKSEAKGICGHNDLRLAFGKTTHHDPGPDFPWKQFLRWVEEAM